jgi:hypothetical protein
MKCVRLANSSQFETDKTAPLPCAVQAAKTYLEKHLATFPTATLDELVKHGLRALSSSLADGELTAANTAVAIVGKGTAFTVLEDDNILPYIEVSVFSCTPNGPKLEYVPILKSLNTNGYPILYRGQGDGIYGARRHQYLAIH